MTRTWAPKLAAIQDAIAAAILAERDANAASLPSYLHGDGLLVGAGMDEAALMLEANLIRVLSPINSTWTSEVTNQLEATLFFPVVVRARALSDGDALQALLELVGLIVDAVQADGTLGGLVAGPASQAFQVGTPEPSGLEAYQDVQVGLIVRG